MHVRQVMQPGGTALARDYLDRLADAIVSLEYYIETLQAGAAIPGTCSTTRETALGARASRCPHACRSWTAGSVDVAATLKLDNQSTAALGREATSPTGTLPCSSSDRGRRRRRIRS